MSNRYTSSCPPGCKVYIGGLTQQASREEVEGIFERYGRLTNVFVARNPPGFAFVEYENSDDAEDSVRALDGRNVCGARARVEISHGKSKPKDFSRDRGGFRDRGGDRRMERGGYGRDSGRDYERDRPRRDSRDRDFGREKIDKSRSIEKSRGYVDRSNSARNDKRGVDRDANERTERRRPVNLPTRSRSRS